MKKELTNEEIAKVFAMYWGCPLDAGLITRVDGYWIKKIYDGETDTVLKLIPLEKISDEDAIEVAKLTDVLSGDGNISSTERDGTILVYDKYNDTVHTASLCNVVRLCLVKDYDVWYYDDDSKVSELDMCRLSFIHEYLISKGYAVPLFFAPNHWANGKTAIELGIAIDATTIKAEI